MDWSKVTHLIVVLNIFGVSRAFFQNCEQTINIPASQTISVQSPNYTQGVGYVPGTSCRYTLIAPVEYQVRASCYMNMYDPSKGNCTSERFYFAVDGKQDLSTSTYYCGTNNVALTSNGNQMVLAYVSNTYSGIFDCNITTVCDCGWSISSRIVGGANASPNEFTPMAAIVALGSGKVYCGGTVVSSKHVLTAAHCLRVTNVTNTAVAVGEHDISVGTDTAMPAVVSLAQAFIEHPGYSNITNYNDIGLIVLQKTILWSRAVAAACLPFFYTSSTFAGSTVTATGWGSTSFGGPSSNILQKVNLNVLDNTQCKTSFPNVIATQMCTYTAQKDTCQYDSGGPLFYRGPSDPRLFLVALVSLGEGCGGDKPAINTRLTSYLSWIESYTNTLCRRALA